MTKLKTLKDILNKGQCPDCSKKADKCNCNYKELFVTIKKSAIRQEAIKWIKEDIRLLNTLTIPELRKISEIDLERWMKRLNITEKELVF